MKEVVILGRGLAALTAAWLLCEKGLSPVVYGATSGSTRRIALNASTVELIETLFGIRLTANESAREIRHRTMVGWGERQDTSSPWPSLAIDADLLTADIDQRFVRRFGDRVTSSTTSPARGQQLVIDTIGPHHPQYRNPPGRLTFGHRVSTACSLRTTRPLDGTLVERTADGWLFLLPATKNRWTLYVVSASPDSEPDDSIVNAIESSSLKGDVAGRTPAESWHAVAPTLHHPLATNTCIRAGEAAFTFDPLSGDGVGYAIRSAVLAATVAADVVRAECRGLDYYQFRLGRAFRAHLEACRQFYSDWNTPGWQREVASTNQGLAFLERSGPQDRLSRGRISEASDSWLRV